MPARIEFPGSALVERERGVDEIAAVLGEPFGPIERACRLLAAGERYLEFAEALFAGLSVLGRRGKC